MSFLWDVQLIISPVLKPGYRQHGKWALLVAPDGNCIIFNFQTRLQRQVGLYYSK